MHWIFIFSLASVLHFLSPRLVLSFGADFLCSRIPGLTAKQREICEREPDAIAAIGEGTKLGLSECQHQFRFHRWNCTTLGNNFGHIVVVGSREAAFLYALSSAGVTYAITQACSRGNISSCGCAPPTTISTSAVAVAAASTSSQNSNSGSIYNHHESFPNSNSNDWGIHSGWRWGGCSADVHFAVKMARVFLDSREIEGDARSLMNLHNNKAGRKIVQLTLETECKCHGVSGSCTLKTCWLKLAPFRKIGDAIVEKYNKAKPVVAIQNENKDTQQQHQTPRSKRSLLTLYIKPNAPSPVAASAAMNSFSLHNNNNHNHNHYHHTEKIPSSSVATAGRSISSTSNIKPKHHHHQHHRQHHESIRDMKRSLGDDHNNHNHHSHHKPHKNSHHKKYKSLPKPSTRPKRTDLVYLDQSPNYCEHDSTVGSLGTRERRCERNTTSSEHSCDVLCCGRGYNTHQVWRKWKCNCKFRWCCQVECNDCEDTIEIYTCN